MTDWGAVSAAWAGAAGSFAAVVVALYIAGRGWRDAAARETRAQAHLVHCYTGWAQATRGLRGPLNPDGPVFVVRNDSEQPVYRVEIPGSEEEIEIPVIPAGDVCTQAMRRVDAQSFGFGTSAYQGPYPVAVEFSDAAGLRWMRNRDGSLHQSPGRTRRGKLWERLRIKRVQDQSLPS